MKASKFISLINVVLIVLVSQPLFAGEQKTIVNLIYSEKGLAGKQEVTALDGHA